MELTLKFITSCASSSLPGSAVTRPDWWSTAWVLQLKVSWRRCSTIILNLKKLALKLHTQESKVIELKRHRSKSCDRADIMHDNDVQPQPWALHLHPADGANWRCVSTLVVVMYGANTTNGRHATWCPPIDSIYTPPRKLSVENTRIGQKNVYDKLTLDIFDRTVQLVLKTLRLAAKILTELIEYLSLTSTMKRQTGNYGWEGRSWKRKC